MILFNIYMHFKQQVKSTYNYSHFLLIKANHTFYSKYKLILLHSIKNNYFIYHNLLFIAKIINNLWLIFNKVLNKIFQLPSFSDFTISKIRTMENKIFIILLRFIVMRLYIVLINLLMNIVH